MAHEINKNAFGYSLAILSVLCMLLLGIFGNIGIYLGAVELMESFHMFFSLDFVGIITGMIEGGIWGFIFGWLIAFIYNKFI